MSRPLATTRGSAKDFVKNRLHCDGGPRADAAITAPSSVMSAAYAQVDALERMMGPQLGPHRVAARVGRDPQRAILTCTSRYPAIPASGLSPVL